MGEWPIRVKCRLCMKSITRTHFGFGGARLTSRQGRSPARELDRRNPELVALGRESGALLIAR
jgi:hypothetical protein